MVPFFALLAACANDFGLQTNQKAPSAEVAEAPEPAATDTETAASTTEDTASAADTGTFEAPPAQDTGSAEVEAEEDPAPEDDCTESSDLVYVLSRDDSKLYTFDPATARFTALGRVSCGTVQTPGSMSVDRNGVAYIRYADNSVYAVDVNTLGCTPSGYADRSTHFDSFGMGYATDSSETWRDQLYVANADTLGVLDTTTWAIRSIGAMPSQSELTGNAAGELWAMLPLERVAELRRLDKANGAALETLKLPAFPDPTNIDTFAFATWNSDFYLFVREYGMGSTTDVYKVTRAGVMSTLLEDIGFDVVGAGVSTCAPS